MNITLPLVSIIVINYNYGCFLRDCLSSIASQDYEDFECIVIDNASTDNSLEVFADFVAEIDETTRKKISLHEMPVNLYQTGACFAGLKLCSGSYIVFVDADDLLLPNCLSVHIGAHFACRDGVGLSCGDMLQFSSDALVSCTAPGLSTFVQSKQGLRPEKFRSLQNLGIEKASRLTSAIPKNIFHYIEPSHTITWPYSATSAFCFRRDALDLLFQYQPTMKGSTDAYLAHGIASLNGGVGIDLPVAAYRIHTANIFARHAPLNGFYNFNLKTELAETKRIAEEVIRSHLHNIDFIESHSKNRRLFFSAITSLAAIGDGLKPSKLEVSSFFLEFLLINFDKLHAVFGGDEMRTQIHENCISARDRSICKKYLAEYNGKFNTKMKIAPASFWALLPSLVKGRKS